MYIRLFTRKRFSSIARNRIYEHQVTKADVLDNGKHYNSLFPLHTVIICHAYKSLQLIETCHLQPSKATNLDIPVENQKKFSMIIYTVIELSGHIFTVFELHVKLFYPTFCCPCDCLSTLRLKFLKGAPNLPLAGDQFCIFIDWVLLTELIQSYTIIEITSFQPLLSCKRLYLYEVYGLPQPILNVSQNIYV